jgi:hypothetical protein
VVIKDKFEADNSDAPTLRGNTSPARVNTGSPPRSASCVGVVILLLLFIEKMCV